MNQLRTILAFSACVALHFSSRLNGEPIHVKVEFEPQLHNNQRIDFVGMTNLPPGTAYYFRVGPKKNAPGIKLRTPSDEIPWGAGSVRTLVRKDGVLKGSLKTSGKVKTGVYVCKVYIPIQGRSRRQTDDVYKIVGKQGENLTGPLVQRGTHFYGDYCKIEVRTEIDFRKDETEAIERRERGKYKRLLETFVRADETLLSLHKEGVLTDPTTHISLKWKLAVDQAATAVEFLLSQDAIDHLRKIAVALHQVHAKAWTKNDREFAAAQQEYESAIEDFQKFIDGIK